MWCNVNAQLDFKRTCLVCDAIGAIYSLGYSCRVEVLTTHSHMMPRLKKKYSCTTATFLGFHGLSYGELYFYIYRFNKIFISCTSWILVYFAGCQGLALVLLCTVFCRYKGLGGSVFLWCQIPICTAPSQTAVAFHCWQLYGATNCRLRPQPCYFTTRNLLFRRANNNTCVAARRDAECANSSTVTGQSRLAVCSNSLTSPLSFGHAALVNCYSKQSTAWLSHVGSKMHTANTRHTWRHEQQLTALMCWCMWHTS